MRSVKRVIIAGICLSTLAGCATTQQQAARLQLNDARIRGSQLPLRLSGANRVVSVLSVNLVAGAGGRSTAIVVDLHNAGAGPVSDLPLLVGVAARGSRRTDLNGTAGRGYFQNHVPAIPAGGTLRWVLTVGRALPAGAVPFALVGVATGATDTEIKSLPLIRIGSAPLVRTGPARGTLVHVENASSVPQYQLQVYAIARRDGRDVAAGQATIANLGGNSATQLRLTMVGDPSGASLSLEAPPTIFN